MQLSCIVVNAHFDRGVEVLLCRGLVVRNSGELAKGGGAPRSGARFGDVHAGSA